MTMSAPAPPQARPAPPPPPPPAEVRVRRTTSDQRFALLLMVPAALFLTAFVAWPVLKLGWDSLFDTQPLAGTSEFVGLGNFADVLGSADFRAAAWRTVAYTVFVVTCEFVLGLATALLFNALG